MRESNRLDDLIEWLQGNRSRIDLASAVAAGAGLSLMGVMLLNVSYLRTVNPLDYIDVARLVLMATIPYLIATLIIRWSWSTPLRRILPTWVVIACLGSLLIVVSAGALSFFMKAVASSASEGVLQTIPHFMRDKVTDGLIAFVILTLLTLPITGTVYYSGSIIRAIRRWQTGPEPPSILGSHERRERGL